MAKKTVSYSTGTTLCVIWVLTAIAVLCVTFVYFGKLNTLFKSAMAAEPVLLPVEVGEDGTILTRAEKTAEGLEETIQGVKKPENVPVIDPSAASAIEAASERTCEVEDEAIGGPVEEINPSGTGSEPSEADKIEGEDGNMSGRTPEQETEGSSSARIATVRQTPDENGKVCYFSSGRVLDPSKPMVAMTFDDGPSTRTGKILEALKKVNGRATFFMVGYQLDTYKQYVQAVYDAGCEIGNHTVDHARLTGCSADELRHEIYDNEAAIQAIVPVGKLIVRPPYGSVDSTVKSQIDRPMFNWSVDSQDWETRDTEMIVAQVKQDVRDGYIILMHDIYDPTMNAAIELIPWLTEQGYQLVTLSEMFELREGGVKEGVLYRFTEPAQ